MKKLLALLQPWLMKLLIVPPIVVGLVILVFAIRNRMEPERVPEQEISRVLRVITVERMDFVPRAVGYGTSEPAQIWQAIAEVKGRVVQLHPDLNSGSFIPKDTLLVRLDDTDTQLAIGRLQAEIAEANSNLAELEAKRENYNASKELEVQALAVATKELERMEKLLTNNAASRSDVDSLRRNAIAQQQAVQSITSSLNLLPTQIKSAQAKLAVTEANLAEKNRDLGRLEFKPPFDCRIGPVDLEVNQFVAAGEILFDAQAISSVEIEAQVSVRNLRRLFDEDLRKQDLASGLQELNQRSVQRYFDVDVVVRYETGGERSQREATFERIREQLDAQTRTSGVVVSIKDPFKTAVDGPPPVSGTYCEVELRGKPRKNQVIIPRSAIRDGQVFVLDDEDRLRPQAVSVLMTQAEFAVIEQGLEGGERLVVSDPTPAVIGMLVTPELDDGLLEALRSQAMGEGTPR